MPEQIPNQIAEVPPSADSQRMLSVDSSIAYLLMLIAMLGMLSLLDFYMLPRSLGTFEGMGAPLPVATWFICPPHMDTHWRVAAFHKPGRDLLYDSSPLRAYPAVDCDPDPLRHSVDRHRCESLNDALVGGHRELDSTTQTAGHSF